MEHTTTTYLNATPVQPQTVTDEGHMDVTIAAQFATINAHQENMPDTEELMPIQRLGR
jgi:hypothetical protein